MVRICIASLVRSELTFSSLRVLVELREGSTGIWVAILAGKYGRNVAVTGLVIQVNCDVGCRDAFFSGVQGGMLT